MTDFIGVDILNLPQLQARLNKLPIEIQDEVVPELARTALRLAKVYSQYRYKSRAEAYPEVSGWFSEKQRKYVMAAIRRGDIKPGINNRTGALGNAWQVVGADRYAFLANTADHAKYVIGDTTQARQPALVGWKKIMQRLNEGQNTLIKQARIASNKAIKRLGLQ